MSEILEQIWNRQYLQFWRVQHSNSVSKMIMWCMIRDGSWRRYYAFHLQNYQVRWHFRSGTDITILLQFWTVIECVSAATRYACFIFLKRQLVSRASKSQITYCDHCPDAIKDSAWAMCAQQKICRRQHEKICNMMSIGGLHRCAMESAHAARKMNVHCAWVLAAIARRRCVDVNTFKC